MAPLVAHVPPPTTETELLDRASEIAGLSLGALAERLGWRVPQDPVHAKGWFGQLVETALGASASSLPEPDFQLIGVELKTLPINGRGRPKESTYVCTVPLTDNVGLTWENSLVRRKLNRVLWLPVEAEPEVPLSDRRIGAALLWSPNPEEEQGLRRDWEELMDMVCLGELERLSARHGTWLQIRPKAADSRALCASTDANGDRALGLPRGFYLRAVFTARVLARHDVSPR